MYWAAEVALSPTLQEMEQNRQMSCPMCVKSYANLTTVWRRLDQVGWLRGADIAFKLPVPWYMRLCMAANLTVCLAAICQFARAPHALLRREALCVCNLCHRP